MRRIGRDPERVKVTADQVIAELALVAFGDIRTVFAEDGSLKRPEDLDDDTAAALSSVEVVTRSAGSGEVVYVNKIKRWDKVRALELLARHFGLLTDKMEHSGQPRLIVEIVDPTRGL